MNERSSSDSRMAPPQISAPASVTEALVDDSIKPDRADWIDVEPVNVNVKDESTSARNADRSGCIHSAMRILAGREHSKVELKRKLLSRSFDETIVESTLERLAEDGLQSDERFTESFVRSRINRGQGPVRIRMELLERGIADSMVAPHLDMGTSYWLKIAREIRERRFGEIPDSSDKSWSRQARFLSQRGFPSDVVMRALGG
ncbi:MAG: recombination regulator RecX [Pseudomonadaceae bacterium]|nr:recombination regulator RecX [Pseudomonadaceae bacterium]